LHQPSGGSLSALYETVVKIVVAGPKVSPFLGVTGHHVESLSGNAFTYGNFTFCDLSKRDAIAARRISCE
jgi:hypothetical protein